MTLGEALARHGIRCAPQDVHRLDEARRATFRPDLVLYRGGRPISVMDAKYTFLKVAAPPVDHLYQLLAYCTALGITHGHLIYAATSPGTTPTDHVIRCSPVTITAHALNLNEPPSRPPGADSSLGGQNSDGRHRVNPSDVPTRGLVAVTARGPARRRRMRNVDPRWHPGQTDRYVLPADVERTAARKEAQTLTGAASFDVEQAAPRKMTWSVPRRGRHVKQGALSGTPASATQEGFLQHRWVGHRGRQGRRLSGYWKLRR
ncbi:hypothetical protein ACIBCU_24325 [Streptomyces sp. NPDC051064]|uniref:5-methylcytosine restriction system specificity protein McrC n=1 Tax=Streptomyces sp. NPDC051064 TaxID=3365641 RepID=UPI0037931EEA